MTNKEAIEMMQRCAAELRQLRKERDTLVPQAEAYRVMRDIVGLMPQPARGYGEDLVWILEKRIKELESKPADDTP